MEERIVSIQIKSVNGRQKFGYKITGPPTGSSLKPQEFRAPEFSISFTSRSVAVTQGKIIATILNSRLKNEGSTYVYSIRNLF